MTRIDQGHSEKLTAINKVLSLLSNCYCKIRSFIPSEFSLWFSLTLYFCIIFSFFISLCLCFLFLCLFFSISLILSLSLSIPYCLSLCDYQSVCLPSVSLVDLFILFSLTKLFFLILITFLNCTKTNFEKNFFLTNLNQWEEIWSFHWFSSSDWSWSRWWSGTWSGCCSVDSGKIH